MDLETGATLLPSMTILVDVCNLEPLYDDDDDLDETESRDAPITRNAPPQRFGGSSFGMLPRRSCRPDQRFPSLGFQHGLQQIGPFWFAP